MTKAINIVFVLAAIGCAGGNKAVVPTPTAAAPMEAPPQVVTYSVKELGEGWKAYQDVTLPTGQRAVLFIQHKTDGKPDAAIIVYSKPSSKGTPKDAAIALRAGDEKLGIIVSDVTCSKENPPLRCQYQAVGQGPAGPTNARAVMRAMESVKETVAIIGLWPPARESAMLKTYEAVVEGLTATIKK